jgi:hypothetical protein
VAGRQHDRKILVVRAQDRNEVDSVAVGEIHVDDRDVRLA